MATQSDAINALLSVVEGQPVAMAHMGRLLQANGEGERAVNVCLRALQLSPDDAELSVIVSGVLSAHVPKWHFRIVSDHDRNRAYEAALTRTITPGCHVLEIGAGSGLLAMMAARAGAAAVYTCEENPVVAHLARGIIAANGYADRVHVIGRRSTDIDVARDMGRPADLLVSEIYSNNLIGEGALPVLEDAWRRLLIPSARVIPCRGRVVVALAEDAMRSHRRMEVVNGFDLSRFNLAERPSYAINAGDTRLTLRSQPTDLFSFDFQSERAFRPRQTSLPLVTASEDGVVNGVAQWIALDLDAETTCENRPGVCDRSSWAVMFHPLVRPSLASTGATVVVHGRHDRQGLQLWATEPAQAGASR
jgi:type II protein arginine methyltransferase